MAETIRIMQSEGLERATMRRLAEALDTGPASLYAYIKSTTELHAAVLEELIGTIHFPTEGPAEDRLDALLASYSHVMFAYPGLARSALVIRASGPNAVLLYDRLIDLLIGTGIEPTRAAWGVDLILQHLTANAAEHSSSRPDGKPSPSDAALATLTTAIRGADPARTPLVLEHADALLGGAPQARAWWAITAILAGIRATPSPLSSPTPGSTPSTATRID